MKLNRLLCIVSATATTVFATVMPAQAQGELTKHFVFTESAGFMVGERTMVSAADSVVYPDPLGRYALIEHKDPTPRPYEVLSGAPAEIPSSSLLLYDAHTGRTKTLWRDDPLNHPASIVEVAWLSGVAAALVVTSESGDPTTGLTPGARNPTSTLELVRPSSASFLIRTVTQRESSISVDCSPVASVAVVMSGTATIDAAGKPVFTTDYFTVTDRGEVGPNIPVGPNSGPGRWSDDGLTAYFVQLIPATVGVAGEPPTKARRQLYSYDVKAQNLQQIDKLPPATPLPKPIDTNPLHLVSGALFAQPPGAGGQQPTAKSARFAPLWAARADGKHEGRLPTAAVIAPDAQGSYLLADDSAVLYVADHILYAVPLTRQRRPDFDAAYRKMLQKQTMQNAKTVGLALLMYSQDYDDKYPPADGLADSINPYLKSASSLNNPETDDAGFTYLLNGQGLAGINNPAMTAMGYLAGPGGRAIVYADGHVTWEDSQ